MDARESTGAQSAVPSAPKVPTPHDVQEASTVLVAATKRGSEPPSVVLPVQAVPSVNAVAAVTVPSQVIQKSPAVATQHVAVSTKRLQTAPAQVPAFPVTPEPTGFATCCVQEEIA